MTQKWNKKCEIYDADVGTLNSSMMIRYKENMSRSKKESVGCYNYDRLRHIGSNSGALSKIKPFDNRYKHRKNGKMSSNWYIFIQFEKQSFAPTNRPTETGRSDYMILQSDASDHLIADTGFYHTIMKVIKVELDFSNGSTVLCHFCT